MSNIRTDVNFKIIDGSEVVFRSPADCSAVTGLKVYYLEEDGSTGSREFVLADAHGNDVGNIDHLFAEDVVVKVILDVTNGMAFVQNADTNAYLENRFAELEQQIENADHGGDTPTPVTSDDLFLVTIDHNAKTASHSESEIKAAKDSGKLVVTTDRYGMLMSLYDADSGCFEGIYRSGSDKLLYERYTVAEDKSVTIEQGEVNDNFIITVNGDQKTCDKTFTEVQQALEDGKDILVRFVRSIGTLLVYPVIVVSDGGIVISIVYHSSTTKNTAASVVMVLLPDNRFDLAVGEASFPPAANNVADGKVLTVSGGNAVWADPPASGTGPKGDKGDPGEPGADGKDGISTTISLARVDSGNVHGVRITTMTKDGSSTTTDSETVNDGTDGNPGAVYVPTVTQNGNTLEMSFKAQAGTLPTYDRSYTVALPEGTGSDDLLLVTFDWDTMKASHSSEEIAAAVASGKIAFMTDGSSTYDLKSTHENACYFSAANYEYNLSFSIMVNRQKKVEYSEYPIYPEELPTFDLTEMGLPPVSILGDETGLEYDLSALTNALRNGPVKINYNILNLDGTFSEMEGIVTGVASLDDEFVQITAPGCVCSTGYRFMLCADVYMDGMYVWTTGLGGTVIDTVDMGLTLTNILQSREMTEAAFEQMQAIAAAGPVRLLWRINYGTESDPYLVDFWADLTPVTCRSVNGSYESITFSGLEGRYSYYIVFVRDGSYYWVDYKIFAYEAT